MSPDSSSRAVRLLIAGRVQGVGFRYFTQRAARGLGLVGWVRNLPSGEVEARVAGSADGIAELRRQLEAGPSGARVDKITETPLAEAGPWREFSIEF